ncbi:MAG: erythromycin esterase family protein [Sphingobacteriales bacterium]|nr:MAG: erythromycin esterase family protein [Sphingobacteriales bacterium]
MSRIEIPSHELNGEDDLDSLIQQIGDARIVLLGEASHGTAEFYQWRAAITKRLIREKGFNAMAVEGEWADSYRVNQFIKGPRQDSAAAVNVLKNYDRWPTWMWGNYEVASLITWLNHYNQGVPAAAKAGFYGLDVYCLWESSQELMPYLQPSNSQAIKAAKQLQQCFRPYSADATDYSYAVARASASCRNQTANLWEAILQLTGEATAQNEASFVMQQNALVALNAERYYRTSVSSYPESWNIRDRHMMQTIKRLLEFHGPQSKLIIWEHNTHVGDARYTDMERQGMVNVGQLAREEYGADNVFAVGFGTYEGTVIAADSWGSAIRTIPVPKAPTGTWENMLHNIGGNRLLFSDELKGVEALEREIGHRAIGVVYDPQNERGNYVPSVLPGRYDAFIFIDKTTALHPINIPVRNEPPDTYPSGY